MKFFFFQSAVLLSAASLFSACSHPSSSSQVSPYSPSSKCYTEEKKYLEGDSMEPKLKNGQEVIFLKDYYSCTKTSPKKGDIVSAISGANTLPLIKTVVATDQDIIELQAEGGYLLVNGQIVTNSLREPYFFSKSEQKMLSQYLSHNHLPSKTVFLLGDNVHHSTDSRKFGAVAESDIIGKFFIE